LRAAGSSGDVNSHESAGFFFTWSHVISQEVTITGGKGVHTFGNMEPHVIVGGRIVDKTPSADIVEKLQQSPAFATVVGVIVVVLVWVGRGSGGLVGGCVGSVVE
jgi:hypothetical protein